MARLFARLAAIHIVTVISLAGALVGAASASDDNSADAEAVTWMVRPSDGQGEDGRSWIELELDPGESIDEHMLVRNLSAKPITFRLIAADGYFTESGRFNMLTSDKTSVAAGTWIEIQDAVEVPSGADVIVPFRVRAPANAAPGDYAAGVAAAIRSGEREQIGVESRVGFRVMTRVAGELLPKAEALVSAGYAGTWNPFEAGSIEARYTVTNTGNTRLSFSPRIIISTLFGLISMTVPGEEIIEMAPGESRSATVESGAVWPLFVYSVDLMAPADVIVVGDDDAPRLEALQATNLAMAVPWPQLAVVLLAALLVWWCWAERRRRDRRIEDMLAQARDEGHRRAVRDHAATMAGSGADPE